MYFLNPEAFWAFFLVLVPILIHLFNLRRVRKIYFSNLSFLKDVSQQRKSKSTLKKLLVLTARVLAIVFIVLAFCRPVFPTDDLAGRVANPVIYLDNSLSLQSTDASGNLLLINGISSVKGLLDALPRDQQVGFVTNNRTVVKWEPVSEASEQVLEVDYSENSISLMNVYEKVKRLHGEELYFFSDFQKSTAGRLEDIIQDTSAHISLFKLQSQVNRNLYIDSVYLDEPLSISTDNKLNVLVKNTDTEPAQDVLVKIFRGELQLASFTVSVGARSVEHIGFDTGSDAAGNYRIEIEDSPIVFDNVFYFSINPTRRPLVVILSDSKVSVYLESVFSNVQYFNLVKASIGNASFQSIEGADLLILDHLKHIPEWLLSQIAQVKGKVAVFPAGEVDLNSYQSLPGFSLTTLQGPEPSSLAVSSLKNPFFDNFFEKREERMNMPVVSPQYGISGYYDQLLGTDTGQPFLVRNGKIYFFTGSLKGDVTTFPKHALFVPVMYKLAQRSDIDQLYWRINGNAMVLGLDSVNTRELLELVNPAGSYLPSFRVSNDQLILELPEVLNDPGVYYLTSAKDTLRSVAINYNKKESEIESYSMQDLLKLISGYKHVSLQEISDVQDFVDENDKSQNQDDLWKYALFLALVFIISELILLRFIK